MKTVKANKKEKVVQIEQQCSDKNSCHSMQMVHAVIELTAAQLKVSLTGCYVTRSMGDLNKSVYCRSTQKEAMSNRTICRKRAV